MSGANRDRRRGRGGQDVPRMILHKVSEVWSAEDHRALCDYIESHELLEDERPGIPESALPALAMRLDDPAASVEERKRVMLLLAHHGSSTALLELEFRVGTYGELERFARHALEEAGQWYELCALPEPGDPCPCGSRRKFAKCCGARPS